MRRGDWIGLIVVAASLAGLLLYRRIGVEPRFWLAACAAAPPPPACLPRQVLLWLQFWYVFGAGALGLGLWAFLGGRFAVAVAAVTLGAAAVVDYNATWGMVGLALGAWAWLGRRPERASPGVAHVAR